MTGAGGPQQSMRRRLRDRWWRADKALKAAQLAHTEAIVRAERAVGRLRESERIAYRKLYESVPCDYCGAKPGSSCYTDWPEMHTARAADCMKPLADAGLRPSPTQENHDD